MPRERLCVAPEVAARGGEVKASNGAWAYLSSLPMAVLAAISA